MKILTNNDVLEAAKTVAYQIELDFYMKDGPVYIYGIPRGGISSMYAVLCFLDKHKYIVSSKEETSDVFIDDLVDSGKTKNAFNEKYPNSNFYTLFEKYNSEEWVIFPWEQEAEKSIEDAVLRLNQFFEQMSIEEISEFQKNHFPHIQQNNLTPETT